MVLRSLEERLERAVEGMFARVFRSGLQPIEVARRLVKDLDANRGVDAAGRAIGPNHFEVQLASADHARFELVSESLRREFATAIREHAKEESLRFLGRVVVDLVEAPSLVVGRCRVRSWFDESSALGASPAYLELPDGSELELDDSVVTIGRLADRTIVLADPNASRHHADLAPEGDSFVLIDLGSTNGTKVNGRPITRALLADGDELTFGTITIRFHLR